MPNTQMEVPARSGDEFQVHTGTTGPQYTPSTATLTSGEYVILWSDEGDAILGQRFALDGTPSGDQFQVNTHTGGLYGNVDVAALEGGGFVAAWHSENQDGDSWGIFAQIFTADGSKDGDEFQVNSFTPGAQFAPNVEALEDGGFVIVWADEDGHDGDGSGVFGQMFSASGNTVGDEFQINSFTERNQQSPDIGGLQNGGFVVVWDGVDASVIENNGGNNVFAQLYDETGAAVGDEFRVNSFADAVQSSSTVAVLNDGSFVVVWTVWPDHSDNGAGVYGQRYTEDGSPIGAEFQVNTLATASTAPPAIDALLDGGFVVSWRTEADSEGDLNVHAQMFAANGNKVGEEFVVNSFTDGPQESSSLTALANGGFLVSWTSVIQNDGEQGVYAQAFTGNPSPRGGAGADHLFGNEENNTLVGMDGDDTVDAGGGNDTVWAGAGDTGNDQFFGGAGDDILGGGAGHDFLVGDGRTALENGSDTLFGGAGNDVLFGSGWSDGQFFFGLAPNVIWAGDGDDIIIGDAGNDTLGGGLGNDNIQDIQGDNVIYGGKAGDDSITGGSGSDTIFAGADNDIILANGSDDLIFGGSGADTVDAGQGSDSIYGGAGDDLLSGGDEADTFFFGNNHGTDMVTDFNVTEDTLFLANTITDFTSTADVEANATEVMVGGTAGLLIDTGGENSVFLVGLGLADIPDMALVF